MYINGRLRGIYQIFRHKFSIIQYSPLKCIQIANRWTYSHRQNYGKKNNYGNINYGKKKVRNFSIIDRRRLQIETLFFFIILSVTVVA